MIMASSAEQASHLYEERKKKWSAFEEKREII